jgi:hypothetical protein
MDRAADLPSSLDRYRRQLERAIGRDVAVRRRRRRFRLGALAAATAAVVVALNVLPSGDGGNGRLGTVAPATALERVATALQPRAKTILHIHMVGRQFEDGRDDIRWEYEGWIAPGALRSVQRSPEGSVTETELANGFDRLWDADSGRVLEVRSQQPDSSYAQEDEFRDEALAMLHSGQAEVAGHERVGERDALKIVAQGGARTFLVDARDYTPIELRTRGTGGGTVLRFVAYERQPLTEATRAKLSIAAQHPGAATVRDARAYQAATEKAFPRG